MLVLVNESLTETFELCLIAWIKVVECFLSMRYLGSLLSFLFTEAPFHFGIYQYHGRNCICFYGASQLHPFCALLRVTGTNFKFLCGTLNFFIVYSCAWQIAHLGIRVISGVKLEMCGLVHTR